MLRYCGVLVVRGGGAGGAGGVGGVGGVRKFTFFMD